MQKCKKLLKHNGFKLKFLQKRSYMKSWGHFDVYNKEFLVCMKNKYGYETFLHEFCHFLQWRYARKKFKKLIDINDVYDKWTKKKINLSDYQLTKTINGVMRLEYECEEIAIKLIQKYKLDIDLEKYIKIVNCYLFDFHVQKYTRKTNIVQISDEMLSQMPKKLYKINYYLNGKNINDKMSKFTLKSSVI